MDNGELLRRAIEDAGISQALALALFNEGQARPLSLSTWKAYLAKPDSARKSPCPTTVLDRMKELLRQ
jgi:hypothetical protein